MLSVSLQVSHNNREKTQNINNEQKGEFDLPKLSFFSSSESHCFSMKKTSENLFLYRALREETKHKKVKLCFYSKPFRYAIVLFPFNSRGKSTLQKNYSNFC